MTDIASLKIKVGVTKSKAEDLLAALNVASEANKSLQSALEHVSELLLDGGLVLQDGADSGKVVKLTSLAAAASDDLPLAD